MWVTGSLLVALVALPGAAFAFSSASPADSNGSTGSIATGFPTNCSSCHSGGAGVGSVAITGVPSSYDPSTTYSLVVTVTDSNAVFAGFQLSVEDASGAPAGSLVITDATNTQLTGSMVGHTTSGFLSSGSLATGTSFTADWTSPASDAGPVTFWAAGNAVNGDFSIAGDTVHNTSATATITTIVTPVPMISSWGLGALVSLMLVGGTVLRVRRSQA